MKPKIKVRFYPPLKELLKTSSLTICASDVLEALRELSAIYGKKFSDEIMDEGERIKSYYILFVDGKSVDQQNPAATKLKSGDVLDIFPPVAGG